MIHRSLSPRNYLRNISGFCTFVQTTLEDLNDFFWYDVLYKTQRTLLRDLTETNGFSEVMNWKGGLVELFKLVFSLISAPVKASYSTLHARMDEKITWTSFITQLMCFDSHVRLIVQQKASKDLLLQNHTKLKQRQKETSCDNLSPCLCYCDFGFSIFSLKSI